MSQLALSEMKQAKAPTSVDETPASICQIDLVNRPVVGDTYSFEDALQVVAV